MNLRWIALGLLVLMGGGAGYWLYSQGRIEDMVGILVMMCMTMWSLAVDAEVDEKEAYAAEWAKREANS